MALKVKDQNSRSVKQYLLLAAKGFCMGASDVVPGVSGGTMAFIMGIYEDLIDAIRSFNMRSARLLFTLQIRECLNAVSWQFLLSVGIGILLAIFTLAQGLAWLLDNQPVLIWSFFLGLILASVFTVVPRIKRWGASTWISFFLGMLGIYFLVGIVPGNTPNHPLFLFISGATAICAMILPGISGSFILVLMGKYQYILEAVNQRDFGILLIFTAGAVAGIIAFSRLLGWLLKRYHDIMVAFLIGLMLGSLRKVWPWKETIKTAADRHGDVIPVVQVNAFPNGFSAEVVMALGLMGLGFLVVILLDWMAGRTH
jgi:putative membrane protein